jgi:hypothetical protein
MTVRLAAVVMTFPLCCYSSQSCISAVVSSVSVKFGLTRAGEVENVPGYLSLVVIK